ncbi:MAG TPA: mechanosensitive ion channel domain-containing protein [Methanoregula sp.]|nr:mechanosensitive ion channel domain-containing protein [Methanoregula sp.]
MKRKLLIFSVLVLLSAGVGAVAYVINDPLVTDIFSTSLVLTGTYFFFQIIIGLFIIRRITDLKTRYTANKVISVLSIVFIIAICLRIWVTDTSSLIVSYGIIGAGLAFALQDVFKNFVGGILIMISSIYRVGDRISIDEKFGDVMDIGVMSTTLMEIRGWVSGDQPSGRLLMIPNGLVINHPLYNYTRDHSFIWDEISIPLTYDSDWRLAKDLILGIVIQETASMTMQADEEIERIGEKYYLPKKVVEPSAYITLTDNWITLDVRYVSDARGRRLLRTRLSELILSAIEKDDRITISSTTVTVTSVVQTSASREGKKNQPDDH